MQSQKNSYLISIGMLFDVSGMLITHSQGHTLTDTQVSQRQINNYNYNQNFAHDLVDSNNTNELLQIQSHIKHYIWITW